MSYMTREFGISSLFKLDLKLFSIVMIIVFLGMITLFSVSNGDSSLMLKQGVRILIGLVAMILLAQIHPDNFKLFSPALYFGGIFLLVLTIFLVLGNQLIVGWTYFLRFQPSELMKIFVPLMIASFILTNLYPKFKNLVVAAFIIIVPGLLIAKQPDLGTAILITTSGVIAIFLSELTCAYILRFNFCHRGYPIFMVINV